MSFESSWKRYKVLRLRALLSCLIAMYMVRLPSDLAWLLSMVGYAMPVWLRTDLSWALFPLAAVLVGLDAVNWLKWPCPQCGNPYFARGPKLFGRDIFLNPMASSCGHCGLEKWKSVSAAVPAAARL